MARVILCMGSDQMVSRETSRPLLRAWELNINREVITLGSFVGHVAFKVTYLLLKKGTFKFISAEKKSVGKY